MDKKDETDDKSDKGNQNCSVTMYKPVNKIQDIALLHANFDLRSMPNNYLRRRSQIEELIYRAVASETQKKSPFSSFRLANDCISHLNKIDILTGIKSLKSVLKMPFALDSQVSVMVHRIGDTWLLDEFDVNSFFIHMHRTNSWQWFRNFLVERNFHLTKPDYSRNALFSRNIYGKFLYHTVNSPSSQLLQLEAGKNTDVSLHQGHSSPPRVPPPPFPEHLNTQVTGEASPHSGATSEQARDSVREGSGSSYRFNSDLLEEEHLRAAEWKLEDLSCLVGSDLAIFGTKTHPCISLKLSHYDKPINVLTGIDIWLENIINEVPEVAMCFHNEGIVMQDYQILATNEVPGLAGFREEEVRQIMHNLGVFLQRNATKEGHTYWLFKEQESEVVKLYDLTTLHDNGIKESNRIGEDTTQSADDSSFHNPFIMPVAMLCARLAERRMLLHRRQHEPDTPQDRITYLTEVFRLLRNCVNILAPTGTPPSHTKASELLCRATLLLCQLFLDTTPAERALCLREAIGDTHSTQETVSISVNSLRQTHKPSQLTPPHHVTALTSDVITGDLVLEAFESSGVDKIMQMALIAADHCKSSLVPVSHFSSPFRIGGSVIDENIDSNLIRIMIKIHTGRAETSLNQMEIVKKREGGSKTSALKDKKIPTGDMKDERELMMVTLRDAYIAYLFLQKMPNYESKIRVLEVFTMAYIVYSDLRDLHPDAMPPLCSSGPPDPRVVALLHQTPVFWSRQLPLLYTQVGKVADSFEFIQAVVKSLREMQSHYSRQSSASMSPPKHTTRGKHHGPSSRSRCTEIATRDLPIVMNMYLNTLVELKCNSADNSDWLKEVGEESDWSTVWSRTLTWLAESMEACSKSNPDMASILSCGRAKLYRLRAAEKCVQQDEVKTKNDDTLLMSEEMLYKAISCYNEAHEILRKGGTNDGLIASIVYDRIITLLTLYDTMFSRAWSNPDDPNTALLSRATDLASSFLKSDAFNVSKTTLIPFTILRVRLVSGSWYLAWKNQKHFPHEAMLRDLRDSYTLIVDHPELNLELFIVVAYIVVIQASHTVVLSVKTLVSILEDAVKAIGPLQKLIASEHLISNELVRIHVDTLSSNLLAVVHKLVIKSSNPSKTKGDNRYRQLYANMLKCKATEESNRLEALQNMLQHISDTLLNPENKS